jgi:hypothetical protein
MPSCALFLINASKPKFAKSLESDSCIHFTAFQDVSKFHFSHNLLQTCIRTRNSFCIGLMKKARINKLQKSLSYVILTCRLLLRLQRRAAVANHNISTNANNLIPFVE